MESNSKGKSPDGGESTGEATIPNTIESARDTVASEDKRVDWGQDSGVSVGPHDCQESSAGILGLPKQESKQSVYITSTPIKKKNTKSCGDVLSRQIILDDPLLSSIDGDLTEHQVDNLSSDDGCDDDNYTKLYETKIKDDRNLTLKLNTTGHKSSCSKVGPRISRSHSFSGVPQVPSETENLSCIKRNLFDIPVSPKLKNKVRERLYTLVNSMDGFEGQVNLDCDEEVRINHSIQQAGASSQVLSGSHLNLLPDTSKRLDGHWCVPRNTRVNSTIGSNRVCECQYSDLNPHCLHQSSLHNQTSISALGTSVSERYGAALSNILATQMRTLNIHQEQLTQEKLSFALGMKDQELNQTVSHYQDRFQHMSKLVEEQEVEVRQLQKRLSQQEEQYKNQMRQLEDRHEQQLIAIRSEAEKKIQEAAARTASTCKEVMDSCDLKISDIVAVTKERAAAAEGEYQAHIKQLNFTISRLNEVEGTSKDVTEKMKAQIVQETENLSSINSILQEKLSVALSLNEQLQEKVKESERRERDVTEQLTFLQARLIETVRCQADLEREMKAAAREAARQEAKQLLAETGEKYEELLASVQHHNRAQIEEYKMAVRVLKRKLKKMDKD
ncbi:hypothetical protein Pmani_016257 [Petrolisthes manimaculis]|uniref:Uncharacterized protein n=1 Tax=Petrolisthes manimaculis TaxID=1843537 RepID=A0AAE1UB68_9EUCA|nr:hypothetical protein Pmani_016257 [Petrolisthes manimaculis]